MLFNLLARTAVKGTDERLIAQIGVLTLIFIYYLFINYSSKSDDRKDSPPITEAIKLTASPIKKIIKDTDAEKSKRSKNKNEAPK